MDNTSAFFIQHYVTDNIEGGEGACRSTLTLPLKNRARLLLVLRYRGQRSGQARHKGGGVRSMVAWLCVVFFVCCCCAGPGLTRHPARRRHVSMQTRRSVGKWFDRFLLSSWGWHATVSTVPLTARDLHCEVILPEFGDEASGSVRS